ncbi:MAG TPA: hypothetical protein VEA99_14220, partial [Gemmatimonadaceae bacterium]|nr:hypothetical protein [Gemmatimonadaceae bacterium]
AFAVTPEMRAGLYAQMRQRGLQVDSATYAAARPLIDRMLGRTIAQYVFGRSGEAMRTARDDSTMMRALSLLRGARTPAEVIQRTVKR